VQSRDSRIHNLSQLSELLLSPASPRSWTVKTLQTIPAQSVQAESGVEDKAWKEFSGSSPWLFDCSEYLLLYLPLDRAVQIMFPRICKCSFERFAGLAYIFATGSKLAMHIVEGVWDIGREREGGGGDIGHYGVRSRGSCRVVQVWWNLRLNAGWESIESA
jgi:hypothetical protein